VIRRIKAEMLCSDETKMQSAELENLEWGSVRCAKNSPESIYTCPKCAKTIVIHPNYVKYDVQACVGKGRCGNMEETARQMVAIRNASFIKLDLSAHRPFVEFTTNKEPAHVCRMTYETLRKGGTCKICANDAKRKPKIKRAKLIRVKCDCQGVRSGTRPKSCVHHNFLACYPEYSKFWDYSRNTISPYSIAPMAHIKCWFTCLDEICLESSEYSLDDLVLKNLKCSYCSGHKVGPTNCLQYTHPDLCKELHSSNTTPPDKVSHGSSINMTWTCGANHVYDTSPANRIRGHGCPACCEPGYAQRIGGHDHFVEISQKVHAGKYSYPEEYRGIAISINIFCPIVDSQGTTHGNFMQQPSAHKAGSGCPVCSAQQLESKGMTRLKLILDELGFYHGSTYFTEQMLPGLVYAKPLRLDICLPSKNLVIEYDGEQHFKMTGWTCAEQLQNNKCRDLLKDKYCISRGINILRIPYDFQMTTDLISQFINFCGTGKILYASYDEYASETFKSVDFSNILYVKMR
jgi:hypothetical protein